MNARALFPTPRPAPVPAPGPIADADPVPSRRSPVPVSFPAVLVWAFALGLALVGSGCDPGPAARPARERPKVVTSLFPVYDFARRIGEGAMDVTCLVPPGGDPHALQGTPASAKQVAEADLVLLMGLGMDGWVEKLARSETGVRVAVVSEGLPLRPDQAEGAHAHGEGRDHPSFDPHVWLDPVLAISLARRIGAELERATPELRDTFVRGTQALVADLEALDEEFSRSLAAAPRREVITFHGAFAYLFARYGLTTAAVIEPFPGNEPSAGDLRKLVDLTRRLDLRAVMAEPQLPDGPARTIAREIGGTVERLDPCESALVDEPDATYLSRQRRNLAVLRRVLGVPSTAPVSAGPAPAASP